MIIPMITNTRQTATEEVRPARPDWCERCELLEDIEEKGWNQTHSIALAAHARHTAGCAG